MKPTVYAVMAVILTLAVMWSAAAVKSQGERDRMPLNMEQYNMLANGISTDQAIQIIGKKPQDTTHGVAPVTGATSDVLLWQGTDCTIRATFVNDKLTTKLADGLR